MLKKTKGFYDAKANYSAAKDFISENGRDAFLEYLQEQFPDYSLYKYSTSWEEDRKYICKAKGIRGDVIVGWEDL